MITNSVLFQNVDQGKNKFNDYPRSSTWYYIYLYRHPNHCDVKIMAPGRADRWVRNLSFSKLEILRNNLVHLPGASGGALVRKKRLTMRDTP